MTLQNILDDMHIRNVAIECPTIEDRMTVADALDALKSKPMDRTYITERFPTSEWSFIVLSSIDSRLCAAGDGWRLGKRKQYTVQEFLAYYGLADNTEPNWDFTGSDLL